jgi:hypothetical protein
MQNIDALERDWRDRKLGRPLHREMTFTQAGLALGRGTLLAEFEKEGLARGLAFDGEEARLLSLLTAAYREPLAGGVIEKIRRAGAFWRAGEKALAQIHLAFLGLPKIDEADAYRLSLAETALEKGVSSSDLMKALGFPRAARDIEKYNPDQPRVPAGSGRESGQWTSGDGGSGQRQTFVQRVEIRMAGATMSDANPPGIMAGAQYAQLSPTPILTPDRIEHILSRHGAGTADKTKGKFTPAYSTEEKIRNLIEDLWKTATPEDLAANDRGRVIIAASSHVNIDGKIYGDDVGGNRTEIKGPTGEFGTPSVKTNLYVVILDSDMQVITCFPINPLDLQNPRNLPDD